MGRWQLFHSLLEIGVVDRVGVAGIPLLPGPALRRPLTLESHRLSRSAVDLLEYGVNA